MNSSCNILYIKVMLNIEIYCFCIKDGSQTGGQPYCDAVQWVFSDLDQTGDDQIENKGSIYQFNEKTLQSYSQDRIFIFTSCCAWEKQKLEKDLIQIFYSSQPSLIREHLTSTTKCSKFDFTKNRESIMTKSGFKTELQFFFKIIFLQFFGTRLVRLLLREK